MGRKKHKCSNVYECSCRILPVASDWSSGETWNCFTVSFKYFKEHCRFLTCSYFQMIVTPLKTEQKPGNTADTKYENVTRTYQDQVEGEPYITAEFGKKDAATTFTVGDGKYYSRNGITEARRRRRDVSRELSRL